MNSSPGRYKAAETDASENRALARAPRRVNIPKIVSQAEAAIERATAPEEAIGVEKQLDTLETAMTNSGLYSPDELRSVNELRMKARWGLGALLRKVWRKVGRPSKLSPAATKFRAELKRIGLDHQVALEAQRIACMPKVELEKVLARNHKHGVAAKTHSPPMEGSPQDGRRRRQRTDHREASRCVATNDSQITVRPDSGRREGMRKENTCTSPRRIIS
jgi:hypothetical protein